MSMLIGKIDTVVVTPLDNGGYRVCETQNNASADGRTKFSPQTEFEMENVELYWEESNRTYSIVGTRCYEEFVNNESKNYDIVHGAEDRSALDRFRDKEVETVTEQRGWFSARHSVTLYKLKKLGWNKLKKTEAARIQTSYLSVERFDS